MTLYPCSLRVAVSMSSSLISELEIEGLTSQARAQTPATYGIA
jgi:hypothetical protein